MTHISGQLYEHWSRNIYNRSTVFSFPSLRLQHFKLEGNNVMEPECRCFVSLKVLSSNNSFFFFFNFPSRFLRPNGETRPFLVHNVFVSYLSPMIQRKLLGVNRKTELQKLRVRAQN